MAALALIETPLSPARRELKSLGEQLAAAKANLAAAQAPVDRLLQAIGEHQQAEAERVDLRQAHDRALGEWLASGDGPRPEPATELLAAEHRVRETRVTAAAAEQRLADSQRAVDERNARLGSLATQKASAIYRAATEAARDHLRTKALPAMVASLTELSVAESLAAELRRIGVREPEALSAAREIEQAIFATRSSIAVRGDPHLAADFLGGLARDPMAEIPAPQNAEVVHVDPPIIKPAAEDGTRFLNRGAPEPSVEPVFPTIFGAAEGWAFTPARGGAV